MTLFNYIKNIVNINKKQKNEQNKTNKTKQTNKKITYIDNKGLPKKMEHILSFVRIILY